MCRLFVLGFVCFTFFCLPQKFNCFSFLMWWAQCPSPLLTPICTPCCAYLLLLHLPKQPLVRTWPQLQGRKSTWKGKRWWCMYGLFYFLLPAENSSYFKKKLAVLLLTKYSSKPSEKTKHILFQQRHVQMLASLVPASYSLVPGPPKVLWVASISSPSPSS